MTVHISRDYSSATVGYASGKFFTAFGYGLSLFLNKILGYSIVSNWGFNIGSTARTLTVSAATNTNPITITTSIPHGLSTGDVVFITGATGETNVNGTSMVSVVNGTQAILINSVGNGAYSANSATLATGFQYATGNPGGLTGASINITGASSVYAVGIPGSVRTVVAGDVGKPLILKSSLYPTKNSGIFKIASIDTVNNRYIIDYRSSDTPPPEVGTLTWWLYEVETQVSNYLINVTPGVNLQVNAATNATPIVITTTTNVPGFSTGQKLIITGAVGNTGANGTWVVTQVANTNNQYILNGSVGNGTYTANSAQANIDNEYYGDGYNTNNRIILQSPHAAGWQTRICYEPNTAGAPFVSVSVGMGGNSFGDFPIGGVTSYIPLFFNQFAVGSYVNTTTGGGNSGTASRYTFVGDDGGQNVFMYSKTLGATANGSLSMGIPDNEPVPNAPNTDRAYVWASLLTSDFGGIQLRTIRGTDDTINGNIGAAYHSGMPELVTMTSWSPLEGQHNTFNGIVANSFMYSANASDSPFTGTTEVMPIEVWGGVTTDPGFNTPAPSAGPVAYGFNQRFMGTAPFLRNGRANFGPFALTSDTIATLSVQTTSGSGVSPIQVTTTTTNALTTGQTVVISGVVGNTAANGTFVITVINNTTFTLNGTTGNGTYVSGGTVNGTPHWLHLQNGVYLLWNGCAGLTP
jgi:hypothetical protein